MTPPDYTFFCPGSGPSVGSAAYASAEEAESAFAATGVFNEKLVSEGYFVFAGDLRSAFTATVVDGTADKPVYIDGPYLESKEYIGGFWVIEAPDLDLPNPRWPACWRGCC